MRRSMGTWVRLNSTARTEDTAHEDADIAFERGLVPARYLLGGVIGLPRALLIAPSQQEG